MARRRGDIRDPRLADAGQRRIAWADQEMPVLRAVRRRWARERPLKGVTIGACLHVTTETANLCRAFVAGGARVILCASNPLSTQDDAAASLARDFDTTVFAIHGESKATFYRHLRATLAANPAITLDDGGDLISLVHKERTDLIGKITASMEETTTGINRLRAMERDGALKVPVVAVNDALTKHLFDNRYGTGQSTVDGIVRATNVLLAGRTVVCAGYGMCGRGFAQRARGMGAHVVVTEVNPIRALEAAMDGFRVMPMARAAAVGEIFCTLTGNKGILRADHFRKMKDGAILANSGHFDVEIDLEALGRMARREPDEARPGVTAYRFKDGRRLFVLGEGRLVNLACAEGHPASVMDMSFATQALTAEWAVGKAGTLAPRVHPVPRSIEEWIARTKLAGLGMKADVLTPEQRAYAESWEEGT
jgi:adenosylhomocysteinase